MNLSRFGFLLVLIGLAPLRSGILLLQGKCCGCFILDGSALLAHPVLFGFVSLILGIGLVLLGILTYREESRHTTKAWILICLIAGGIAGYSTGIIDHAGEGKYDELTERLTEKGWILFYSNKCPACGKEIDMLGSSVKHLRMIDCGTITCPPFIQVYPTWTRVSNGSVVEIKQGFQDIEELEVMAK